MISSWRRRRATRRARKEQLVGCEEAGETELTIPSHFRCPISLDLMKDPVTLSTGITYDRESIETWIDAGNRTCPITNQALRSLEPIPNHAIRRMVQDWCVENRSFGIERIPTPRIPASPMDVLEILKNIASASERGDRDGCIESVAKMKALVREGERNKRCFATHGAGTALSSAFEEFSNTSSLDENIIVLFEEMLSVFPSMFPLNSEARSHLGSPASLHCMILLLKSGDLTARRNSVLVLKEIVSSDSRNKAEEVAEIDGAPEALYKLIKEPICPTATKAALVVIYRMTSLNPTNEKIITRLVEMGLVNLLIETLVDADRSVCEKALGVLDGICNIELGRVTTYDHSLTVAALVKKLLRVSELATEFSVSVLWKLARRNDQPDDGALVEALQVGAFQKLLLLLQVGCGERTKEKATELLKLLNLHRERSECIDSSDFKDLKRPF
ncbi:U-box domain-containing protein 21-like [Punica granatum]|uniref:U-box domain-containing protein n=2 Tax=Punica granatum TaxID=22663 RepID=A0A218VTF5_PUNGR|nr:U-box domain-containing protein 21-like [Punica granatum]OWM63468.1 hypothetical protein CDL15_Pgr001017 [Punica granatum]PKI52167.1 hypothetical protein CRG98_027437 [Punica granatum]